MISTSVTRRALADDDDRVHGLAPLLVGIADHRDLRDGRDAMAIAFSTSTEYTFSPPVTIMSFTRSTRNR